MVSVVVCLTSHALVNSQAAVLLHSVILLLPV
jgi:hypothetical protein